MRNIFIYFYCISFFLFMPDIVQANQDALSQEVQELRVLIMEMKDGYEARINEMQAKIENLSEQRFIEEEKAELEKELGLLFNDKDEQTVSSVPNVQAAPGSFTGGGMFQNLMMNISLIGDSLANVTWPGKSIDEGLTDSPFLENEFADRISLRETELGLQGVLDPFARADFFIAFEDGGAPTVEEGFITWLYLPFGLQAKAGIFKTNFGKINRTHRPELPQTDYPGLIKNFLGGEGQSEPGISISGLIPNPWGIYSEFTGEILTPSDEGAKGNDQIYLAHLKNFFAITNNSSIELGFSFQTRDISDTDDTTLTKRNFRQTMEGIDLTYTWRPAGQRLYRSFTWQTEFFASQREVGSFDSNGLTEEVKDINSLGLYTFGEYQLNRRLFAGVRFDYSQFPTNDKDSEWAISPYLTFWQSEFTRLRLEYSHKKRNSAISPVEEGDNTLSLQATFTLGSHRPHPF
ncbi:MAG: TonB-dependent receptor [Candidatus Scalindua rubra]|uniref:Uncharacterized protein n=1 Tax=Candidatus Scalindua brodae TaxID=237368 RepID=A0A0B0EK61_9BACT|nr:MAG: hypothetical protein SCABRO_03159 [Candidatus Scalindua brodae]MBZ0110654.1 TonB-dependent receptor [Candidatus Scalindua rubra]